MAIRDIRVPRVENEREVRFYRSQQNLDNINKANRVPGTDEGNIWVSTDETGDLQDSGINIDDVVTREKNQKIVESDYNVLEEDEIIFIKCSTADITVTLPSVAEIDNRDYLFEKIDNTDFKAIIAGNGIETINEDPTFELLLQYESVKPVATNKALTGSDWLI